MAKAEQITLTIGGQDFTLKIRPEERPMATAAAQLVKDKMADVAEMGAVGMPKQLAMAAFQLAFDLLELAREPLASPDARADLERRVDALIHSVEKALAEKKTSA